MAFFPQINSNFILTQLPYAGGLSYETVSVDVESGMRWAFPRRAGNLSGFPTKPLFHGVLNYPNISDTERETLRTFFNSMRGRWGLFSLLDPGGNLLQYSEDYTRTFWDKSNGPVTVSSSMSAADPFGKTLASVLTGGSSDSHMLGVIGPGGGGISGFVVNVSVWVKPATSMSIFLGVANSSYSTLIGKNHSIAAGVWQRIDTTVTLTDNNYFRFLLGGNSTWGTQAISVFGAQAVPSKGSGGYVKAPYSNGGFGYYATVRFDADAFTVRQDGPGHNSLQLPIVEVNP